MIVLFTDFGLSGPYIGQMKAALYRDAPRVKVIDLFADAPRFDPKLSAYLLAAYVHEFALDTVFLGVVDPGVGGARAPVIVRADGRWFVGPDNGLFNVIAMRSRHAQWWDITWQPKQLSASFHGRDLFAPVAARLAMHQPAPGRLRDGAFQCDWPADLAQIVYVDHYGNCMTGLRVREMPDVTALRIGQHTLTRARTFADVATGQGFWYENSSGLAEIAVNQGRADHSLGLALGDRIVVES
jgi:S-adenosylmethionine hydrolase